MEIRQLEGFVAIAEELHFGRASERLFVAQPALSQLIKNFEKQLGVKLFDRNTRAVTLTENGAALLPIARRILADVDLAHRVTVSDSNLVVGQVRIGFAGASSRNALPLLARAVKAELPGVELLLQGQTYAESAARGVAEGTLDIGFSRTPIGARGLEHHVYEREHLVAALPSDHPLAQKKELYVSDLADEPFVTFPGTSGSSVRDALTNIAIISGFRPRIVQEAPDSYTILSLVAAGVGVTITVSSVQHIVTPGLVYRTFSGNDSTLDAVLVWKEQGLSRASRAVLDIAKRILLPSHAETYK